MVPAFIRSVEIYGWRIKLKEAIFTSDNRLILNQRNNHMDNTQNITRAEVQEMINEALSSRRSESAKPDSGGKLKDAPPLSFRPSGWFDSVDEATGSAIGRNMDVKDSHERAGIKTKDSQEQSEPEQEHLIPKVLGGGERGNGVMGGGERASGQMGGSFGALDRKTPVVPKPETKTDKPSVPEQNINDIIAGVVSMLAQRYISREEVDGKIEAAVPPQIRTMGCASGLRQNVGQFLKLENSDSRTAVWGLCDASGNELPDGDENNKLLVWDNDLKIWTAGPTLPSSGDYVLVAQDGVLSWVELQEFACE
jgi:hypothetical protein